MIGLKRGTVRLLPHDPAWAGVFEQERFALQAAFGDLIIGIEHVGSTAIPGIPAKPIIDMAVGVASLEVAREMKAQCEALGYRHAPFVPGDSFDGLQWQELYVKGPPERRTHHAHVVVHGGKEWNNYLLFRDHLRRNPGWAREYAELKRTLANRFADDRKSYTKGKEQFIQKVLSSAELE